MLQHHGTTKENNKNIPDLKYSIKNKPAFYINARVVDKFYKDEGIPNVYYEVTDSEGGTSYGNPQTDDHGYMTILASPIYPGKTVTYTISQISPNPVDGYYFAQPVQLEVTFNNSGKIESYRIVSGNEDVYNFDTEKYKNTKSIDMILTNNMPRTVKLGLYKYDKLDSNVIKDVIFSITKLDMNSGVTSTVTANATDINGYSIVNIDEFIPTDNGRTIKYTIHEDNNPANYRNIEDISFIVEYNKDGSIANYSQIISDGGIMNEQANLDVASDGKIRHMDNKNVHMTLEIPNDNTFDVIIKNEDLNGGYGIEGSKFNVTINGTTYPTANTDNNGITKIRNLTLSGPLTIVADQQSAGVGYRLDTENKATINLNKGKLNEDGDIVYSLDLDPTQEGIIDSKNAEKINSIPDPENAENTINKFIYKVEIDERYGTVTITFKNVTKNEITLIKEDYATKTKLSGAEFEVIGQQINSVSGAEIGEPVTYTTTANSTTNSTGRLYLDLGVAPQNEKWIYTFKEITAPSGYFPINDVQMTVVYDQYGRITIENSQYTRLDARLANRNINCRDMIVEIYNGQMIPEYTVKVFTKDADNNVFINESKIHLGIKDDSTGALIKTINSKNSQSAKNGFTNPLTGETDITKDITQTNINRYGETETILTDSGVILIDGIDFEGMLNIDVSELQAATGYTFGNHKTDGNVKVGVQYVPIGDGQADVQFTIIDDSGMAVRSGLLTKTTSDGLEVTTDEVRREIRIVIYNDSQVEFNIQNNDFGSGLPVQGIQYNITSEISGVGTITPTSLNSDTALSNAAGLIPHEPADRAYAKSTVIYRLQQYDNIYYYPMDIYVAVQFDTSGNIKSYRLLSCKDTVTIEPSTGGKQIYLTVQNKPKNLLNYKVQLEKWTSDVNSEGVTINRKLKGAKYKITVEQEDSGATAKKEITGTTNELGLIDVPDLQFSGVGKVTITAVEEEAPVGYELDSNPKILKLYRNPFTGNFEESGREDVYANVQYKTVNTDSSDYISGQPIKLIIQPYDTQNTGTYSLVINKYSTADNKLIENNHAKFQVTLKQENDDGIVTYEEDLGELETNDLGKIEISNLTVPEDPGEYMMVLTETKEPKGFVKYNEDIVLGVSVVKNDANISVIQNVYVLEKTTIIVEGMPKEIYRSVGQKSTNKMINTSASNQTINIDIANNIIPNYKVIIEKHDMQAYGRTIQGATFEIKVREQDNLSENGIRVPDVVYTGTTDQDGKIVIPNEFKGFGNIIITLKEMNAPNGYIRNDKEMVYRVYRDPLTGNFTRIVEGDRVNISFINTNDSKYKQGDPLQLWLMPLNEQETGKFTLQVNKYNTSGELIEKGQARFSANIIAEDSEGNITYSDTLNNIETVKGRAQLTNITIPKAEGEYKLILTETKAPEGYMKLKNPAEIKFEVGHSENGEYIINNVTVDNKNVNATGNSQWIYVNVKDLGEEEIAEDEYSLDITKVDGEKLTDEGKRQPIGDMALFKVWLPDTDNTAVYTETSQTSLGAGKLDYCYVEQDKNYSVRLTHMNLPTEPGLVEYRFREILPPNGYEKIPEDLILTIDFRENSEGKLYIHNATSSNTDYLVINTKFPVETYVPLSIDILNNQQTDEEPLYLKSRAYIVGDKPAGYAKGDLTQYKAGDEFIWRVDPYTTLADFIYKIDTNADTIEVTKPDGTMVNYADLVGTDMTLKLSKGVVPKIQTIEVKIVVSGDIAAGKSNGGAGDGKITITDYTRAIQRQMKKISLLKAFEKALDLNEDGKLTITDYTQELREYKKYIN